MKDFGRNLLKCSDEFASSPERRKIRRLAQEVNMRSITVEAFFKMCSELFNVVSNE